jgi:hypothetical protein
LKKLTQFFLLLSLLLGFSSYSEAALLIEPVLGYNLGSKVDFVDESYSGGMGMGFGGRLGYQNLGFQLGVDYLNSSLDMDDNKFESNLKTSEWAGFVGFRFPILFKVYAGYIFAATGESKVNGNEVELSSGSGMKAGIGFTGFPLIDLNIEYRKGKFDEFKYGGTDQDEKVDYSSILFSVSLPFAI